jgi:hypothetical protein
MYLAIGDVVRDRTDLALGTVAGAAKNLDGTAVAVLVPGETSVRLCHPGDVEVVARYARPATARQGTIALVALLLGTVAAYFCAASAQGLGASWPLMCAASLGGFTAVMTAYQWITRLAEGPRRFRV